MIKEKEALELFNEKALELKQESFYKYLQKHKSIGWKIGGKHGDAGITKNWPDEESIKAFILNYRLFIRNGRDGISFRCLSQIYPKLEIPDELKKKICTNS